VILGAGLAGLGCAFRLWHEHGVRSVVYEANPVRAGGRVHTLHGYFAGGQYTEEHGEFISSEHSRMRKLAAAFGLTLDNVNRYPPHTTAADYRLRFNGRFWSQAALDREWREWARELFLDAATKKAPWPTLYNKHTKWARRWDHMSAAEWIDHIPGGLGSDFPGAKAAYNGRAYYTWSSADPYAGGAYSYFKVGQYIAFNGIQGRLHGNLHFAGEHTSVNFHGFMEGALRSGYRCAREIAS
jgi:monoamine oxidase